MATDASEQNGKAGEDWLDAEEARAYLKLKTINAVYQGVYRGEITAHRFGKKRLRFKKSELDKLIVPVER